MTAYKEEPIESRLLYAHVERPTRSVNSGSEFRTRAVEIAKVDKGIHPSLKLENMELAARDDFDAKNCFCLGGGTVRGLCSLDQSNVNFHQFSHFDLICSFRART